MILRVQHLKAVQSDRRPPFWTSSRRSELKRIFGSRRSQTGGDVPLCTAPWVRLVTEILFCLQAELRRAGREVRCIRLTPVTERLTAWTWGPGARLPIRLECCQKPRGSF